MRETIPTKETPQRMSAGANYFGTHCFGGDEIEAISCDVNARLTYELKPELQKALGRSPLS